MSKVKRCIFRGVARIFQRGGGGGHTVSSLIVMAFSPRNIIGCFLKKGLQMGCHGHPRTPPRYAHDITVGSVSRYRLYSKRSKTGTCSCSGIIWDVFIFFLKDMPSRTLYRKHLDQVGTCLILQNFWTK